MTDTRTMIVHASTMLFAEKGYEGVSMRNIADEVAISAAALYNHFKDKQTLYITVISETFANRSGHPIQLLDGNDEPLIRLERFISNHCQSLHEDLIFHRLIQRELLDGDEDRLEYLAQEIFGPAFECILQLLREIKPDCDAEMIFVFIIGMVHKQFELNPLLKFLPNCEAKHNDPTYITNQVMAVLKAYLGEK